MTSSKPYLIRAIYEWIIDNNLTPYLMVNTEFEGIQVPQEYVEDNTIVLNISPTACRGLHLENDRILFSARFGEAALQICVPPEAVMAVYARENGRGMVFGQEDEGTVDAGKGGSTDTIPPAPADNHHTSDDDTPPTTPTRGKPKLKVVK